MNAQTRGLAERLTDLRESFDRSFVDPPRPPGGATEHLLAIRAADHPYALRLNETAGLFADRAVTPLPGPVTALCGVATFRGVIVPVYSLAALLGRQPRADPRWLALVLGAPALAVGFDALDGHLRLPAEALVFLAPGSERRGCLSGLATLPDQQLSVVDLAAVRDTIHVMAAHPKEGEVG
ncbi:chemotaxis protein CheW [Pilimelia columellifera]|uniref:CheW-like domain-containing protein n=1 Tax=Pilimelia columellifera subsp. columellifera TaxID=706583 RepID=A0ABN3NMI1_9ACTN